MDLFKWLRNRGTYAAPLSNVVSMQSDKQRADNLLQELIRIMSAYEDDPFKALTFTFFSQPLKENLRNARDNNKNTQSVAWIATMQNVAEETAKDYIKLLQKEYIGKYDTYIGKTRELYESIPQHAEIEAYLTQFMSEIKKFIDAIRNYVAILKRQAKVRPAIPSWVNSLETGDLPETKKLHAIAGDLKKTASRMEKDFTYWYAISKAA